MDARAKKHNDVLFGFPPRTNKQACLGTNDRYLNLYVLGLRKTRYIHWEKFSMPE